MTDTKNKQQKPRLTNRKSSSKQSEDEFNESNLSKKKELQRCKFCNTKLPEENVKETMKHPLEEKWGIWGGVEYPFIQLYNVQCPSQACSKKYTVKLRKSSWWYK